MSTSIEVQDVSKRFGDFTALEDITFSVADGEIIGMLGPDGAGKSTLIRVLATLTPPDAGVIQITGIDAVRSRAAVRPIIGFVAEEFALYTDLTVGENLMFFADVFGVSGDERRRRIDQVLRFSRLGEFIDRRSGALSGGMKQKLALSCALIHEPKVLLLDEPTRGVDPLSRREFWRIIQDVNRRGVTVIISTPYADEAERCDRVMLMANGRIRRFAQPSEIRSSVPGRLAHIRSKELRAARNRITNHAWLVGDEIRAWTIKDVQAECLHDWIQDPTCEITWSEPDLETALIALEMAAGGESS